MDGEGLKVLYSVGAAILGAAATYGAMSARLTRAEKDIEAQKADLEKYRTEANRSRESQGERIGQVSEKTSQLEGQCQAILSFLGESLPPLGQRMRRNTKPPVPG